MAISYGSRGAAVEALQTQLSKLSPLAVDGVYGQMTEKAVQAAYARLGVPGVSGAASDALIGALAAKFGPGGAVMGATPPVSSGAVLAPPPPTGLPMAVKVGLGAAGLALLIGIFS